MSINREKTKMILFILAEMQNEGAVKNQIQKWYSAFQHLNVTCHPGKWIQNSGQMNVVPVHRRRSQSFMAGADICRHAQSRDPSSAKRRCWGEGWVYRSILQPAACTEHWGGTISQQSTLASTLHSIYDMLWSECSKGAQFVGLEEPQPEGIQYNAMGWWLWHSGGHE